MRCADSRSISLPANTYPLTLGQLTLQTSVQVNITGDVAGTTIIDGGANGRVLQIAAGSRANISALTIQNGKLSATTDPDGGGAGILNQGTLTADHVAVTGNVATHWFGAGIYNQF